MSILVEVPKHKKSLATSILINAVTTSLLVRRTTHTLSKTKASVEVPPLDAFKVNAPPPLTEDHRDTLSQINGHAHFSKCMSKQLINGTAPHHRTHSPTLMVYFTNMPWMPSRNFWH